MGFAAVCKKSKKCRIDSALVSFTSVAEQMNANLCDRFSVGQYPMLLWGPPAKFASAKWDPKQEKSDIQQIDDGRTSQRLLNWINKRIGRLFLFIL